ncbi:hypothetical protein TWF281_004829 [Arthrobotrys megalospora]
MEPEERGETSRISGECGNASGAKRPTESKDSPQKPQLDHLNPTGDPELKANPDAAPKVSLGVSDVVPSRITEAYAESDVESQQESNPICNPTTLDVYDSTDELSASSHWTAIVGKPIRRTSDRLFSWKVNCYVMPLAAFSSLAQIACLPFLLVYTITQPPDVKKAFNAALTGSVLGGWVILILVSKKALFWWKRVDGEYGATKSRWEILMGINAAVGFAWLWCLYYLVGLRDTVKEDVRRGKSIDFES